jgi:hypothetical protein
MQLTTTPAPTSAPAPTKLPVQLTEAFEPIAIEREQYHKGGGPDQYAPLWCARDESGAALGWKLHARDLPGAVDETKALSAASTETIRHPEDYGFPALMTREVPQLAIIQATDGAYYATTLHTDPIEPRRAQHVVVESWTDHSTTPHRPRSEHLLAYVNAVDGLQAIVDESRSWTPSTEPTPGTAI